GERVCAARAGSTRRQGRLRRRPPCDAGGARSAVRSRTPPPAPPGQQTSARMALSRSSPRVSVGLTVYNGERFLAETLDSLVAQTFEDFELIVCDNASTDRTAEIVRDYAARDVRIRYVRNERNIGASGNERRAFAL